MLELARPLLHWDAEGRDFAVATVVAVSGSGPRPAGSAMAVGDDGAAIGSVSGGCVEGAVYELCRQSLEDGVPVLERFGYSDDEAFAVGLTCGGVIDVLVQPVRADCPDRSGLMDALRVAASGQGVALVRSLGGSGTPLGRSMIVTVGGGSGSMGGSGLTAAVRDRALGMLQAGATGRVSVAGDGRVCAEEGAVLVETSLPPPRLLVFGAIDFAAALVRIGKYLGYRVTLCDAREVFATPQRFPDADEVVVDWPHRYLGSEYEGGLLDGRSVVCVLTHDAKFDVPVLVQALEMPLAYVGAMGSRRTHAERLARLREAGVSERALARLHSPIGLDLGGRSPEETALSIAAEIVARRCGGTGLPLSVSGSPLHTRRETPAGTADGAAQAGRVAAGA
ncbi:XdhC/CoxI family protein [Streptomyces sp. NPDC047023]|uniref:XdhC family protein n=1 Tax=Streptomyces sp. NPDC047023 TaxID=3155139 RepID=UPI003404BB0B